jgi:phytoene dehydrogenase-like protein
MHCNAIVVGGGHNGIVAAFYLARGGMRPLVLERRPFVGGACVTEEFAPGYRASTGAYVLGMLRPAIYRDMQLMERGLTLDPSGPTLHIYDDGSQLWLRDDLEDCRRELSRFSEADAESYPRFLNHMERMATALEPMMDVTPPDLTSLRPRNLLALARLGRYAFRLRRRLPELTKLLATSASTVLDQYFESDRVKAAFGWHALNDNTFGPASPGTAYVLIHDVVSGAEGSHMPWGFVRGGMQQVVELMADAARDEGAEIRLNAEVERIMTSGGATTGVRLVGGEEITADVVLSNADPIRTFFGLVGKQSLPDDFVAGLESYRINGTSLKINLAVDRLPLLTAYPNAGTEVEEYHRSIIEFHPTMVEMERGADNVKYGRPTMEKMNVELCFPTVHDPSLAPPGKHIITIDANMQPYNLKELHWDDVRETVAEAVLDRIEIRFPGLRSSILHRQVLSPLDLERLLGLTGGHALHGDMGPDQLFVLRPLPGWGQYRTPVDRLYMCGAGTHPGGGVTGANGRNCAREVLRRYRKRGRSRLRRR